MKTRATAYGDEIPGYTLADIPPGWCLKVELGYADGGIVALVYEQEPDEAELRDLMWGLQQASAPNGYTVTVVQPDGTRLTAPAIGADK